MPLFERLFRDGDTKQNQVYDAYELTQAVVSSLTLLLSVRAPILAVGKKAVDRTVLDYGIVETEGLSPLREEDLSFLEIEISEAVAAFEPRLENTKIEAQANPENGRLIQIHITGDLRLGLDLESFEFNSQIGSEPEQVKHD